jgi:hypothetical protein
MCHKLVLFRIDTVQTTWVTPETPPPVRSIVRTRVPEATNQVIRVPPSSQTIVRQTNAPLTTLTSTTNQAAGGSFTPTNQQQGNSGSSIIYTPGATTTTTNSGTFFVNNNSGTDSVTSWVTSYDNVTTTTTNGASSSSGSPVRTRYLINNQWSEWTTSY